MFHKLYPDRLEKSTYQINFKELYNKGYKGVIFDIDNTLVPHGEPADDRAIKLFQTLSAIGFSSCLLSNNKEERVKLFNKDINTQYIFKANKPMRENYLKAMEKMNTSKEETIFVGDQLFTDILGAKRTGIFAILVEPIHPKEEIQIVLKRYLEKVVLFFYHRKKGK